MQRRYLQVKVRSVGSQISGKYEHLINWRIFDCVGVDIPE